MTPFVLDRIKSLSGGRSLATNIALIKHTLIGERTDVEFRAEVFNVTDTPGFAQPNGSFGSPAFGSITSTATDPRVIQFGARISY